MKFIFSIVARTVRYWLGWLCVQLTKVSSVTSWPPWFEKRQSWIAKIGAGFTTHVSLVLSERVLHEGQNHSICDDKFSGLRNWLIELSMSVDTCRGSISRFSSETGEHRQLLQDTVVLCVLEIKLLAANDNPFSSPKTFFCCCSKKRSWWGIDLIFFFPDSTNFSASPQSGKNFPTRPEGFERTENVNFITSAEKCNRAKRKGCTIFFVLCPCLFKLVSMDGELSSALGNKNYFYQVIGCSTQKSSQTRKSGLKLKKHDLCDL